MTASVDPAVSIEENTAAQLLVAIDPTLDDDDILPVWLASIRIWTQERCTQTRTSVRLELTHDISGDGIDVDPGSSLIADLFWRDATFSESHEDMQPAMTRGVLDDSRE